MKTLSEVDRSGLNGDNLKKIARGIKLRVYLATLMLRILGRYIT